MKHFKRACGACALLLFCLIFAAVCFADGAPVCFVRDGGSGDGSSPAQPLGSLSAGFSALADGGTLVVCGPTTVGAAVASKTGESTLELTSVYDGVDYRESADASLTVSANINFYCPATLEHLTLVCGGSNIYLVFNGNRALIGEDILCARADGVSAYLSLVAGTRRNNFALTATDLTVCGGSWGRAFGGSTAAATFADMDAHLTVRGGEFFDYICAAGAGDQSGGASLTLEDGVFYGGVYGAATLAEETFDGEIEIRINGGVFYGKIKPATRYQTTLRGSYTVIVGGGDFSHLTDIEGADKYAAAALDTRINVGEGVDIHAENSGAVTYQNPIRKTADPRIAFVNGMYYYVYTSGQTLSVYKAANVTDLAYAVPELVWDAREHAEALENRTQNIWPSELQYFSAEEFGEENAGWYLFFSTYLPGVTPSGRESGQDRRSYVLKCASDDLQGTWVNPVTGQTGVPQKFSSDTDETVNGIDWCAGESTLRYGGKVYALWIEQRDRMTADFRQIMYLSEMKNPWTVTGEILTLVEPEYDWEREGYGYSKSEDIWYPAVIEGATPIVGDGGELFVLYAASGYWTPGYKVGQMTYRGGDLLDISSWEKSPTPIFSGSTEVCGVGGLSAFIAPDGHSRYILYHGYLGSTTASGRYCFMEPYTVDAGGVHFGVDGHPSPLERQLQAPVNPTPLAEKISGFSVLENRHTLRQTLELLYGLLNGSADSAADIDGDGRITIADVIALLKGALVVR